MMKNLSIRLLLLSQLVVGLALMPVTVQAESAPETEQAEPEKGPHRGRMLHEGDFALELAIFETGVPPEFRVWVSKSGQPVSPEAVKLNVKLTRLGGVVDDIQFAPEDDHLRGDTVIYEPHSFVVTITAQHDGQSYRWAYDNFEGRTRIEEKVAIAMGIQTEIAGPATLHQTIPVYGRLVWPSDATRQVQARFAGEVKQLHVSLGETVREGQLLATVESNESLKTYQIKAPMGGVISGQFVSAGEQAGDRALLELTRTDQLIAELAVYPMDWAKVKPQAPVSLSVNGFDQPIASQIVGANTTARADQAKVFRASLDNTSGLLSEGLFVSARIEVATIDVPLAVKRSGLQAFRDFTVVYAKVGDQYEVRMLELGREAGSWVEVLGGLEPGTEYVTDNSYIIKADIEKSGASHDH